MARFGTFTAVCALLGMGWAFASAAEDKPKYTIKQVMKEAHKDGLMKKVAEGKGTKADAEKLLELYQALAANKPPKGDAADWRTKTEALVAAAKEAVAAKPDFGKALTKAANCADCHKAHKPG
ncbi:MAG: hypothetical protein HYX69_00865 [Planctomycetia bacterium]|nr:hypothetical protein [Planctomycetia bacterium]